MAFNALFQTTIIMWNNIALAMLLQRIQRFGMQKCHVQITSNVAVFTTYAVMEVFGTHMEDMKINHPL